MTSQVIVCYVKGDRRQRLRLKTLNNVNQKIIAATAKKETKRIISRLTKYRLTFGLFLSLSLMKFPMTSTSACECVLQFTATERRRS